MLRRIRSLFHLCRIVYVLAKYDALFFLPKEKRTLIVQFVGFFAPMKHRKGRDGERLCHALQALGPTFIKAGQTLATRADLIGEQVARDLSTLQDKLPSFAFTQAKDIIEHELDAPLDSVFESFEKRPIAAASIAQVHFAVDKHGNDVAVKVLRPSIEARFARDIDLLYAVAELVERYVPKYTRLKLHEAVAEFEKTVNTEMDLRMEAAAACELADNFADDTTLKIPTIDWNLTSRRVLTMERIHGVRIDHVNELTALGHDVDTILQRCAEISFNQIYRDGVFHADMHPGNLFVAEDGTIVAVDFGIVGRLDQATRIYLARLLHAFLNKDYRTVGDVHFDMGFLSNEQDPDLFAQACRSVIEPIFNKSQDQISIARMMGQLFKIFDDFEMEVQPQLLLLQKTLVLAEGIGRTLNPQANFWELSRPLMEAWIKEHLGPAGIMRQSKEELEKLPGRLLRMGEVMDHLPTVIDARGVRLHPDTVEQWHRQQRDKNRTYLWKIILLSATVSALTAWFLEKMV